MNSCNGQKHSQGYTLIELMIAVGLSIFILSMLNSTLVKTASFMEQTKVLGNLLQTGQYLVNLLSNEISMAGFYGEFDRSVITVSAVPDMCQVLSKQKIIQAMSYQISGKNNIIEGYKICDGEYVKPGTDILLVRRVSAQKIKSKTKLKNGQFYIQSAVNGFDVLFGSSSIPPLKANSVSVRQWQQTIYYLSKDNVFKRRRYLKGRYAPAEPLAEAVYDFQLEYGLRQTPVTKDCTLSNGLDFVADPQTAKQWQQVVAVKFYLLLKDSWQGGDQPKTKLSYADQEIDIDKGEIYKLLKATIPVMNQLTM